MIIVAITSTFQVWLVKPALDKIFLNKNSSMLNLIPIIVIIVAIIRGIAAYFQNYLMKYIGQKVVTEMQMKLYSHFLHSDLSFLHNYSTGKIITKFTNDINIMRASVSNVLTGIARESLTVLFLIILMFYQSPALSLIAFTVFPLAVLPVIKMGKRMRKISHATQEQLGSFAAKLDDSFQLIKVVKSYCGEEFEKSRAKKIIDQLFSLYIKAIRTESFSSPIMEALSG
ncbi:MAG: ABC transporter transmembrane domain-containing protein, partial [Alphaproteobacteria bacterium]